MYYLSFELRFTYIFLQLKATALTNSEKSPKPMHKQTEQIPKPISKADEKTEQGLENLNPSSSECDSNDTLQTKGRFFLFYKRDSDYLRYFDVEEPEMKEEGRGEMDLPILMRTMFWMETIWKMTVRIPVTI